MQPGADELGTPRDDLEAVLAHWGFKPGVWQAVGTVQAMIGGEARPIVRIADARYVVRRQSPDLTENDTRFRHAFMRHLADAGLPVPPLLPRQDGTTYGLVDDGIYEFQGWLGGQPYLSDGPASDLRLSAAAAMLGRLHQSSAEFQWQPHVWPEERSPEAIARAYCGMIHQASQREGLPGAIAAGLGRVAEECAGRLEDAAEALDVVPGPPQLHIHGDYQAHNLAFDDGVGAIYDFDAARWSRRLDELAYALLYFAGVRWDGTTGLTPPLVDDGLEVIRVHSFLNAYGREAPPAEGEAPLLAEALTLTFPIVFANGAAEDLVFPEDFAEPPDEEDALARLHWADTFWLWLDRYRGTLAEVWGGT